MIRKILGLEMSDCIVKKQSKIENVVVYKGIAAAKHLIKTEEYKKCTIVEVLICPMGCLSGGDNGE
jgi:iron only hydrogenase large subunit-like protein